MSSVFFRGLAMNTNDYKDNCIDVVEYNGKYTDASVVRNKLLSAGALVLVVICAAVIPILLF